MKDEAVMKRLEPGGFADGDPAVVARVNPFGQVAVHLREDGVGRLVRIEPAPFMASRAVPEFLGQGIASRAGLERSNNGLAPPLDSLRVMVEQPVRLQAPPLLLRETGRSAGGERGWEYV